jgi:hypothetical protein
MMESGKDVRFRAHNGLKSDIASRQPVVLAVHPSLGVNSIDELVTLAKQQPGLNYGLGGRSRRAALPTSLLGAANRRRGPRPCDGP